MKCLIIFLICSIFSTSFAQVEKQLSEFETSYFREINSVQISGESTKDFQLIIDATSLDELSTEGGVYVTAKNYTKFISSIDSAEKKYIEFVNIAKNNGVKELDKKLNYTFKGDGFFKYGSKWEFDFDVVFTYDFKIISKNDEVKYLLIVRSGELTSSSNEYIKMDGFVWVFSSKEEIDAFQEALSKQKIDEYFSKPKAEDLFKN